MVSACHYRKPIVSGDAGMLEYWKVRKLLFSVTLKDCEIQTFCSGGKGGQHQNKTQSGVRIIHRPSGAIGESREYREQKLNKKAAFRRMGESKAFQTWARIEAAKKLGQKTLEERVEEQMDPRNIKIEEKEGEGQWIVT